MEQIPQMTLTETIEEIKYLISTSNGDTGRLAHILEAIKNNKKLYKSDQAFLEAQLGTEFSLEEEKQIPENKILVRIQDLINSGQGDHMRLKHIHDTISRGKYLYQSDQKYLEDKLNSKIIEDEIKTKETKSTYQQTERIENNIKKEATKITKSQGVMPKGWKAIKKEQAVELSEIKQKITSEEEKMDQEKILSSEISKHRSKLDELV